MPAPGPCCAADALSSALDESFPSLVAMRMTPALLGKVALPEASCEVSPAATLCFWQPFSTFGIPVAMLLLCTHSKCWHGIGGYLRWLSSEKNRRENWHSLSPLATRVEPTPAHHRNIVVNENSQVVILLSRLLSGQRSNRLCRRRRR